MAAQKTVEPHHAGRDGFHIDNLSVSIARGIAAGADSQARQCGARTTACCNASIR